MIKTFEDFIKYANKTPELLSLLYDLGLMPEQLNTPEEKRAFLACCIGYALGKGGKDE
jgi:hypothetical protein